jgi:uncharacterized membrane protein
MRDPLFIIVRCSGWLAGKKSNMEVMVFFTISLRLRVLGVLSVCPVVNIRPIYGK